MGKSAKWWIIGAVLFVGALVALKATGVIGKEHLQKVAIEEVKARTIVETVTASGKLYPVTEVKISPDISGEVLQLFVQEGQRVQKGQLLARIDAGLYQNNVTRANAQVNQSKSSTTNARAQLKPLEVQLQAARATYERNLKLYNDKVISAAEFELAATNFKSATANLQASREAIAGTRYNTDGAVASLAEANQNIRRANVYAPMSGNVSKLGVKQGERVVGTAQMAGTEMLRIADMSLMKVDVEIGENDIQKISLGDTAIVEVDAYTKRKFRGFVSKIAQSNTSSMAAAAGADQIANYTVSIELDPSSYSDLISDTKFPFRPGMSASVEILTLHKPNVLAVPINAVTTRDLDTSKNAATDLATDEDFKEYVFVLQKDNSVRIAEVKTAVQDNSFIEVTTGLKVGDKIVVAPYSAVATRLKDKTKVEVVSKDKLFTEEDLAEEKP
jgi:HlyD family secretion protein